MGRWLETAVSRSDSNSNSNAPRRVYVDPMRRRQHNQSGHDKLGGMGCSCWPSPGVLGSTPNYSQAARWWPRHSSLLGRLRRRAFPHHHVHMYAYARAKQDACPCPRLLTTLHLPVGMHISIQYCSIAISCPCTYPTHANTDIYCPRCTVTSLARLPACPLHSDPQRPGHPRPIAAHSLLYTYVTRGAYTSIYHRQNGRQPGGLGTAASLPVSWVAGCCNGNVMAAASAHLDSTRSLGPSFRLTHYHSIPIPQHSAHANITTPCNTSMSLSSSFPSPLPTHNHMFLSLSLSCIQANLTHAQPNNHLD